MALFDLDTSAAHLRDAIEELQLAWQQTADGWSDTVSRKFCQQHLEPIGPVVKSALDAIGHMTQQVRQMQQELEEK